MLQPHCLPGQACTCSSPTQQHHSACRRKTHKCLDHQLWHYQGQGLVRGNVHAFTGAFVTTVACTRFRHEIACRRILCTHYVRYNVKFRNISKQICNLAASHGSVAHWRGSCAHKLILLCAACRKLRLLFATTTQLTRITLMVESRLGTDRAILTVCW